MMWKSHMCQLTQGILRGCWFLLVMQNRLCCIFSVAGRHWIATELVKCILLYSFVRSSSQCNSFWVTIRVECKHGKRGSREVRGKHKLGIINWWTLISIRFNENGSLQITWSRRCKYPSRMLNCVIKPSCYFFDFALIRFTDFLLNVHFLISCNSTILCWIVLHSLIFFTTHSSFVILEGYKSLVWLHWR